MDKFALQVCIELTAYFFKLYVAFHISVLLVQETWHQNLFAPTIFIQF